MPISLIKVDVEGHEIPVLRGAQGLLRRHEPALVLEWSTAPATLGEIQRHIPFPVTVFTVPLTYHDEPHQILDCLPAPADILIVPASRCPEPLIRPPVSPGRDQVLPG
jgi:hypothetical protein